MVILLLLLATIQPKWSFEVPTTVRHTSVRGERIGIALDSTVVVIDRSTGTELVRVATHRGVIEGISLMPGDTTCVVVSASLDTVRKVIVNAVVETDLRTGEELRRVDLATVSQQVWYPREVQTKCAFTHNGRWLYTNTPRCFNSQYSYVEAGYFQSVDLVNFTVAPTGTGVGPYGGVQVSTDDRILMYWGVTGGLNRDPWNTRWVESRFGLVRIEKDTGVFWKKITAPLNIALNARYFYDRRYLYDTLAVTPSESPELIGAINFRALCHNGKNYFSYPQAPSEDSSTITIRELGTNKIVHELLYHPSDRSYRWYLHVDDSLFIIAQQSHITSWQVQLAPELPPSVVHVIPDTMTTNTCVRTVIQALPIGMPFEVETSVTNGSLAHGSLQFTAPGDQKVIYDLKENGEVRFTDTHLVHVKPLLLHPLASWGMKVDQDRSSIDTAWFPRLSINGQYAALASRQWLAVGATDGSDLRSRTFTYQHDLTGAIVSSDGTASVIHDSVGNFNSDGRSFYNQHHHLRFNSLSIAGNTTPMQWRSYSSDQNMSTTTICSPRWSDTFGWKVTLRAVPMNNAYPYSSTHIDGTTNTKLAVGIGDGHMPIVFDQDPQTGELWWLSQPPGTEPWRTISMINAYHRENGVVIDHGRIKLLTNLYFVDRGTYLYADGKLYDRSFSVVGPDTTQPTFSGAFLGSRPFALQVTKITGPDPCYLKVRRLPDGTVVDSIAFDQQIMGLDTDDNGTSIALTFRDGTLQVFATEALFSNIPFIAKDKHVTDTVRSVTRPPDTIDVVGRGLMVAPHPMTDGSSITIERWNNLPLTYHLSDMNGVEMLRGTMAQSSNVVWLDRRDASSQRLSSGVYLLRITDGSITRRTTIVVQ